MEVQTIEQSVCIWILLFCFCLSAKGQSRGTITGVVTDPAGASVPNAKVRVSAPSIGLARETTTNENGYFTAPSLPAGNYYYWVINASPRKMGSMAAAGSASR